MIASIIRNVMLTVIIVVSKKTSHGLVNDHDVKTC